MNIAMVIGAYAALCRAEGAALSLPGPARVYDGVFAQVTRPGRWPARACGPPPPRRPRVRRTTTSTSRSRWRRVWEKLAAALDLPLGPPVPLRLATHMADKAPAWARLVAEQGLVETP